MWQWSHYLVESLSYLCVLQYFRDRSSGAFIGVMKMGDLDTKPFDKAMKRRYSRNEADEKALELCSLWEENHKDSSWHPFKVITDNGNLKVCISLIYTIDYLIILKKCFTQWKCWHTQT